MDVGSTVGPHVSAMRTQSFVLSDRVSGGSEFKDTKLHDDLHIEKLGPFWRQTALRRSIIWCRTRNNSLKLGAARAGALSFWVANSYGMRPRKVTTKDFISGQELNSMRTIRATSAAVDTFRIVVLAFRGSTKEGTDFVLSLARHRAFLNAVSTIFVFRASTARIS